MLDDLFAAAKAPILITDARPIGFTDLAGTAERVDVLIDADGKVAAAGPGIASQAPSEVRRVEAKGAFLSPGWVDLHTHVWWGGTDVSIRPEQCGAARGVTTLVDAGSAGEANFHGLREHVMERARETIYAFLNIGSIGLVACNRVSELIDMRSVDLDRTVAVIEANRDRIVGVKCRASAVITGTWGMEALKLAKKIARVVDLPLMVHVGEPPPLYDDVLAVLDPGDIVTHCFNGKVGGSLLEDRTLWCLVEQAAARGIVLDVGHGGASFSFEVAEAAIAGGLLPHTISTDLHQWSLDGAVWDLATTLSKLLALGMPFEAVVKAATTTPRAAIRKPTDGFLTRGAAADFTLFDLVDERLEVRDSKGRPARLERLFEPRRTIIGANLVEAHRHLPPDGPKGRAACPNCGWLQ
ncbi:amidohydrolase/deacetylase family metallohydrolase [Pinisolibacter sp.]|uniref:amidohydrolase/deacetylase family metallohydrolase n=1 Tax=Pinisolibacter sp. TaxID=2172024 RepID=UPI002FDF0719